MSLNAYSFWRFTLFSLLLLSSCFAAVVEDWSFFRYNSNNSVPHISYNGSFDFKQYTRINLGYPYEDTQLVPNIVIEDNRAYTLDYANRLVIVDLEKNKVVDKVILGDLEDTYSSGIAIFDNTLFAAFTNGYIVAFSLLYNDIKWTIDINYPINSAPIVSDNKLLLLATNDLVVINIVTGDILWKVLESKSGIRLKYPYVPTVYFSSIIFGSTAGSVTIVNKENGETLFRQDVRSVGRTLFSGVGVSPLDGFISAPILAFGDKFFVLSDSGGILLDSRDYKDVWISNHGSVAGAVLFDSKLIFVNLYDEIIALSAEDGSEVWQNSLYSSSSKKVYWHAPLIVNNNIFLANTYGEVFLIDGNDGQIMKQYKMSPSSKDTVFSPPIVISNKILFLGSYGNLYIFDQ